MCTYYFKKFFNFVFLFPFGGGGGVIGLDLLLFYPEWCCVLMSHFSEMVEWNTKWDWENIVSFGPKPTAESPKKKQQLLTEWMIVDDGEINPQQFDLFRSGGDGGGGGNNSGSDDGGDGHNSSARSSISASTDSSPKDGGINFRYHYGNLSERIKGSEFSLVEASSLGSGEPLIGLKLGKRTYFENTIKCTQPFAPLSAVLKKTNKSSKDQNCQVDGCNTDLSQAKEYHRKHRVCDGHSKCPKVIIRGLERRFCQQCSRFHSLCEFDEKKRSCRRRLSDHNARRRKPQQETIQFNSSTRVSSAYYGGNQHLLLNNSSPIRSRPHPPANSIWDGASNSKFTLTEGYPLRTNGGGDTDGQLYVQGGIKPPRAINVQNGVNGFWEASNNSAASSEVFNPGPKGSLISSLDTAPVRALSLLSSNSWDSCEPDSMPSHTALHENFTHPMIHPIPEVVPLSSSEFWLSGQQSMHPRIQSPSNFQESQLFKTTYDEADFYSNILS